METQENYYLSEGDQVYGIDGGFEDGAVHEGEVVEVRELPNEDFNEVDVSFESDPLNADEPAPRVVGGMSTQFISVDATPQELHDKLSFPAP